MTTRMFLIFDGKRHPIKLPFPEADHAVMPGSPCPKCGDVNHFGIQGSGKHPSADDQAWEAEGYATCCKAHVGVIRVETGTLFGVREDRAVQERCRVY